jgi:DNA-binding GntR family transcriptional regulator
MADQMVDQMAYHEVGDPEKRAVHLLRLWIVNGQFEPNERLVERDLARMMAVGRGAVRTALARLESEGLVEHHRHRGARVRRIEPREASEILEVRSVLEGLTARHAATIADEHDIGVLSDILEEMARRREAGDLLGMSDQNAVFHHQLTLTARHLTARRLIESLRTQLVRFQYRTILVPGRSERSFAEHQAIFEAVANGDPDAAESAMRTHLSNVAKTLMPQ